jgi:hypothetical protein
MKNEPAFPIISVDDWRDISPSDVKQIGGGLTKLEYFAGLAMAGLYANSRLYGDHGLQAEPAATEAVSAAQALIAELESQNAN